VRSLHGLFTPEQTQWVLRRERARADRHNGEFSLVLFRTRGGNWPHPKSMRLAKIMLSRARATDEMGRYDEECVCAILPDTTPEGAWRFAQGVCDLAIKKGLRPMCAVYTYPSGWFRKDGKQHPASEAEPTNDRVIADTLPAFGGETQPYFLDGTTIGLEKGQAAEQLEQLLVRPMPRWKRALDLLGASIALTIFSPILMVCALAIKLTSPGPVIFSQKRAGLGGRPFQIYKFRTMCVDAEAKKAALRSISEQDGPAFKLKHDPRVTFIGKILRTTSLDELPQLWNVIKGDMSLVGPRPLPVDESDNCDQWHRQRLEVTPGLTCIWQVTGRSTVTFDEWVRMDITYIRRRKLWADLCLLLQTLPAVLLRKGAR
jgi:lipopolysaccharide/colanic/teichoic acid biosynthesis glycosyltransferase